MSENRPDHDGAIEALCLALADHLARSPNGQLASPALEHLVESGPAALADIYGAVGHLVHYGNSESPALLALLDAITMAVRSGSSPGPHGVLPGDVVMVAADRGVRPAREMVVRLVDNQTQTLLLQPPLNGDYIVESLPFSSVLGSA